jgi:urea transport system substrate-binding protein
MTTLMPHDARADEHRDAPAPRRVLVVDDDPAIREMVAACLEDEDCAVATAADGAKGLAAVEHDRPDVILLDMRMPLVDGWEFIRRYRERYGHDAPIVVMTAATDATVCCRTVGAEGCLPKPFDLGALLRAVDRAAHALAGHAQPANGVP